MKIFLFPHRFQFIGWCIFIPAIIGAIVSRFDFMTIPQWAMTALNDAIIIGAVLGSVFIVCSKERDEDEMIGALRLATLMNMLYVNTLLVVTGTLLVNGAEFVEFLIMNLFLMPILFVVSFRAEIRRQHKQAENEKQD
ncbi:MAG: hypothetical protein K2O00_01210 [Muribaculaceae bacterium]|nr:hypothetical protein [Muribaculaceae bacterium]